MGVDLYWLPLGAGGQCVRLNAKVYEGISAWAAHRPVGDLFHAALAIWADGRRHVIEMAPVWNERTPDRGVVAEGPVGVRALGRWRAFRYEVRCWTAGSATWTRRWRARAVSAGTRRPPVRCSH